MTKIFDDGRSLNDVNHTYWRRTALASNTVAGSTDKNTDSSGFPRSTAMGSTVKKTPSTSCRLTFAPVSASCNTTLVFLGSQPKSPSLPSINVRSSSPEAAEGISNPLASCFNSAPVSLFELSGNDRPDPRRPSWRTRAASSGWTSTSTSWSNAATTSVFDDHSVPSWTQFSR